ncbi:L-2-hydroxyglutarate oxidase [Allocatelliglobosispora scoriae]|uniref:L-2-hydroxyglutarate oxidase n=1 Tax=Allocatelliglobosispora scoriae TaxID=643052 RepID=A0A841BZ21_9ACTN|nr:L-2-hydroxyglutarate oxidase [Allocatelliglobosispora scoriae]MBB5872349.1 L-2-hydroxyglutarate oxidase [Allocatelliglobosispora scoriae]
MTRYVVIGGGIVGLAVARQLLLDHPDDQVTVLEKEDRPGRHQTGHNSGVIHAGVYYKAGSLKATLCKAGAASMVEFCTEHAVPFKITGKLIVATDESQLGRLRDLQQRALDNGLPVRMLSRHEAKEFEPHVSCVAAMHVASTGIVDYGQVTTVLARLFGELGGDLRLGAKVTGIADDVVETTAGDFPADVLINCAGLYADKIAILAGVRPPARIVPFRGEYAQLRADRTDLVKGLIYPVPDPRFPFLGVHLTKMIDGSVHAGPNAVLALAREGYSWRDVNVKEFAATATYPGLLRLARRNLRYGLSEMARSLSARRFAESVAELMPEITQADLEPGGAGVRAQAIKPDGSLVDDFLIVRTGRQVHVLNAPSPAATSSLEIAKHIVADLPIPS